MPWVCWNSDSHYLKSPCLLMTRASLLALIWWPVKISFIEFYWNTQFFFEHHLVLFISNIHEQFSLYHHSGIVSSPTISKSKEILWWINVRSSILSYFMPSTHLMAYNNLQQWDRLFLVFLGIKKKSYINWVIALHCFI